MFAVVITEKGGAQRKMDFDKTEVTIGRVQGNDVILPKGNVSKRHARIVLKDNRFIVVDLKSTNGTYVNGRKITSPLVVKPGDKIYIGDFILTLEDTEGVGAGAEPEAAAAPAEAPQSSPPPLRQPAAAQPARASAPPPLPQQRHSSQPPPPAEKPQTAPPPARTRARTGEPQPRASAPAPAPVPAPGGPTLRPPTGMESDLRAIMTQLSSSFDVHNADPYAMHDRSRWDQATAAIQDVVRRMRSEGSLESPADDEALAAAALREAVGLGALEPLLGDDSVREVVVEGPGRMVIDYGNGLESAPMAFSSSAALYTVARRLMAQAGINPDGAGATRQFALPYGPQVTVVLPPVAVRGPIVEVRRVGRTRSAQELVDSNVLSADMLDLLARAVAAGRNIAVVGPVGSGVTTVAGVLASLAPEGSRIVTAEDVPDLAIEADHVVALATGGAGSGLDHAGVVRQALALRSDMLIIDDVHDGTALEALTAMAARGRGCVLGAHGEAGSDGGLETLRCLARLKGASNGAVEGLLTRSVNVLVQTEETADGHRVVRIAEVTDAGGKPKSTDLFLYDGDFAPTGANASF